MQIIKFLGGYFDGKEYERETLLNACVGIGELPPLRLTLPVDGAAGFRGEAYSLIEGKEWDDVWKYQVERRR